jgi:hypothetical protein
MAIDFYITNPSFKTALAEALYNEIQFNTNNYYYFLGKTLPWKDDKVADQPINNLFVENEMRKNMIFCKKVTTSDTSFIIPRITWIADTVYDQYDNMIGQSISYNVSSGPYTFDLDGNFDLTQFGRGWLVEGEGIPEETYVDEATSTKLSLTKRTTSDVSYITITKLSTNGAKSLNESDFYVLTADQHVYKCLSNNQGKPSTIQPYSTTHEVIQTSDGYIWKFMYTIPNALINKFLTLSYMPVTTAVKSAFYSNGAITSATVDAYGTGYNSLSQLTVLGDGSGSKSYYNIRNITITDSGEGYSFTPTITIQPPYQADLFIANHKYYSDQYIKNAQGLIYKVIAEGTTGLTEPIHTGDEQVFNGTCILQYVGEPPYATAVMNTPDNGKIKSITTAGVIYRISLISTGSGYDSSYPPNITFTSGDGVNASAISEVGYDGHIRDIRMINRGVDYTNATVAIDSPIINSITINSTSSSVVNLENNTITFNNHQFITGDRIRYIVGNIGSNPIGGLIDKGIFYVIAVDQNTFKLAYSIVNAKRNIPIDFTQLGQSINDIIEDDYNIATATVEIYKGFGYKFIPTVTIQPPFNHDYEYSPNQNVLLDKIVRVDIRFYKVTTAGVLGTEIPIHTEGSASCGSAVLQYMGRTASAILTADKTSAKLLPVIENGAIVGVIAQDPGIGYTTADIIASGGLGAIINPNLQIGNLDTRQANTELLAIPGSIDRIDILHNGIDYSYANITITGDGTGCTAHAILKEGAIDRIIIDNSGYGYTYATVTITGNTNAVQAYANPVISPLEGHGKNAVKELFSKNIILSTTIARDKNQGFIVNNDYRQLGIVKNPLLYQSTTRYTQLTGSPCFSVTGDFIYSIIEKDMILTSSNGAKYIVIAKPEIEPTGSIFQILVQTLDNELIFPNTVVTYNNINQATISTVHTPTIDKYSGDIMFIDNRQAFQPTLEQTISIKTIINF